MRRVLELAERGWGRVSPNPLVGAVVAHGDDVVGEGCHAELGREHAETEALRRAGPRARGGTLYVNLEPCAHLGRTPPCAGAIVDAGIARVVMAVRDPNEEASGGARWLRDAGVQVSEGVLREESLRLNAPFLWRHVGRGPYVALKLALTLDGRIAAAPGLRTRITGEAAWRYVHRLRAGYDAVLVGIGTVLADDPLLTTRAEVRPRVPPLRVVVDTELRMPRTARLVQSVAEGPVLVVTSLEGARQRGPELEDCGLQIEVVPRAQTRGLRMSAVLGVMRDRGLGAVLVEGGGKIASTLLNEGLVQRLHLLLAPFFAGEHGVEGFPGLRAGPPGDWSLGRRVTLDSDTALELDNEPALQKLRENV